MVRALVVDDDSDSLDSMCQSLEVFEIEVVGKGYDGEEAFQLYAKLKPDITLLDMKMPNYDGGYALAKIRAKYPKAKVIVVTGYTDYEFDRDEADAIFNKPYDPEKLVAEINKLCS